MSTDKSNHITDLELENNKCDANINKTNHTSHPSEEHISKTVRAKHIATDRLAKPKKPKKKWNEYLWIVSSVYLILGFFNIMFAWIGMLCFFIPLLIAMFGGGKKYCNSYCGRGQLLNKLGKEYKLSKNKPTPNFMKSSWFRHAFLAFFMTMFGIMIFNTYLVFAGSDLKHVVTLLWTFKLPWQFAYHGTNVSPWIIQYAYGFYSVMLTSSLLGVITMRYYRPRSWCVYCPMGTMTHLVAKAKYKESCEAA